MAKPPANVCDGLTPMKTGNSNESLHLDPAHRLCSSNREWDPPVPSHSLFHGGEWGVNSQQLSYPRDVIFPYFLLFYFPFPPSLPSLSDALFFPIPSSGSGGLNIKHVINTRHGKTWQNERCWASLTGTVYIRTLFQVLSFSNYWTGIQPD